MSKVEEIVAIVEKESPGLLYGISREDGITKESLVRKVLALSHGQMVRTHQNAGDVAFCDGGGERHGVNCENGGIR